MRKLFFLSLLILCGGLAPAQEALLGLRMNPAVRASVQELSQLKSTSDLLDTIPMLLPFFDKFEQPSVFPSPLRWVDRYAFVNTDIPVFPPNVGAVTLDALNDSGMIYRDAVPGPQTFIADHLTSRYIRLDSIFTPVPKALSPADSVYLTFYYQPQGRAAAPSAGDSLVLQFLVRPGYDSITPTDTIQIPPLWRNAWASRGMALDTFYINNGRYFDLVQVPVKDTVFFKKYFKFRFFNYVSLASTANPNWQSNCDQWNIDNVYLNYGRSVADTVRSEICFVERTPSMLRNYESMPYLQYSNDPTNEMQDTLDIVISNRDINNHLSSYQYSISNPSGSFSKTYDGGEYTIKPYYTYGYVTYQKFAHPAVPFFFQVSSADSAVFLRQHIVKAEDGSGLGDTITGLQKFYNYYAYDDGTAEYGYGINVTNGMIAYQFSLNITPDTLRAIRIFFNRTLSGNAGQTFFYLCVWNDNGGKPGDTIYSDLVLPAYADSLNQFITYLLSRPVRISGTFYVGVIQTSNDYLNIGFDRYNNAQSKLLYNIGGQWLSSLYSGSLMIRPVVGKPLPVGINDIRSRSLSFTVYPNPCQGGTVTIRSGSPDLSGSGILQYRVLNTYGQTVLSGTTAKEVNVSGLPEGLYILLIQQPGNARTGTAKLVITH